MKRGVVELQFNWVFIAVIGTLILALFAGIAIYQSNIAKSSYSNTVLKQLESIVVSSGVIRNSATNITLGNVEVRFDCSGCACSYKTDLDPLVRGNPYRDAAIFAPDMVKGRRMVILTDAWAIPFTVMNFIYITSPDMLYVFVYDPADPLAQQYLRLFNSTYKPTAAVNKVIVNKTEGLASLTYRNNYQTKFIFLGATTPIALGPTFDGKPVTAITISSPDWEEEAVDISWWRRQSSGTAWKTPAEGATKAVGEASVLAAVFAQDMEMYSCTMDRAVDRLRTVAAIYSNRSQAITQYPHIDDTCRLVHSNGMGAFDQMASMIGFETNANQLSDRRRSLREANVQTRASGGVTTCPYLY